MIRALLVVLFVALASILGANGSKDEITNRVYFDIEIDGKPAGLSDHLDL
jgi:hypothetical protein